MDDPQNPAGPVEGAGDEGPQAPPPTVTTNTPTAPAATPQPSGQGPGASGQQPPTAAQSPVSLQPKPPTTKRTGLAGVVDDMLDDLAGTKGAAKLKKGDDGNYYVDTPELSRKGQWLKIAGEALHGAAAGAAHMQGPGAAGRGLAAGVEAGDKLGEQEQKQQKDVSDEARQKTQDNFNQIKLKMDMGAKEFELARLKVKATDDDIKFAQEQTDRMMKLADEGKAFDLGSYKDEGDLARVKGQNPNFWKDAHAGDITILPQIGPDGTRSGLRVFQTTPGVGNQQVAPGTAFKVFTPPAKPGDPPTLQDQVPTVPMTENQKHAYDLAAYGQMQKWQIENSEEGLRASEVAKNNAEAGKAPSEIRRNNAEAAGAVANAAKKETGKVGYVEKADGTVWIANEGDAKAAGLPFEEMKPGDINKDKQAMRQLNDVQLNTSRYTKAAQAYADPNAPLTYHGKPVSEANPVHPEGPLSLIGLGGAITDPQALRARDNTNLNTLMNKAGYANLDASISAGGHITIPAVTAFGESLSREINSRAYNELSDQGKELYDGYVRTMASIPAYQKALTGIGRSNKEMLDLELANIAHPGMAPGDIVRKQAQFQQNIDKATDGFPRNMVGVKHPSQTRREVEGPPPAQRAPASDVSSFSGAAQQ